MKEIAVVIHTDILRFAATSFATKDGFLVLTDRIGSPVAVFAPDRWTLAYDDDKRTDKAPSA